MPLPPIHFAELAKALLDMGETLLEQWLPGGVRRGHEYVCGSLAGGSGSSCSVNLVTGKWADFSAGEQGGDWLSLYATIHGLTMGKAAMQVARELGLESVAGLVHTGPAAAEPKPPRPAPPPKPARAEPEGWTSVVPVPAHALQPTFKHYDRKPEAEEHRAEYRVGDDLYGYVVRFRTSDGGKDTLPYHYCQSAKDGGARWHWKQWDEPRPLYFPGHALPAGRTVVLVEGEKKGDALQALLDAGAPGVYCVAGWPGGGKAWKKANWSWLQGCTVLLWPDCDAKRLPLSRAEEKSLKDQALAQLEAIGGSITDNDRQRVVDTTLLLARQQQPLLPAHKQPGLSTMLGIGAALRDAQACNVQLLPVPEPGAVVDGWDCGDAINVDGWDFDHVLAFFGSAFALPADAAAPASAPKPDAGGKGGGEKKFVPPAEAGDGDDAFQGHLNFMCHEMGCEIHEIGVTRKLLIAALRKAPDVCHCLGFNELKGAPYAKETFPWRRQPGPLNDSDDLRFGDWVSTTYKLKAASRAALTEAMSTVADERHYHPIREWFAGLQHDGRARIDKWLIYALGMDPAKLPKKHKRYLELVGRFLLLGLVNRVMVPGCKFDYSPVFEGRTGMGKSTLVKLLVGVDNFSDTHFDIGNGKEGMEQLEGLWAYELSEMTAFRRADNEQVKQFFSSTIDRFRGAYGKYVQPHPRQCVIICTTNKRQYLYDLTGNRRFWPIWIDQHVRLDWIIKYRAQLFAEAYALFLKGERYSPTPQEEAEFFVPEQNKRVVETGVQSRLYSLLTREGAAPTEGRSTGDLNLHTKFVTLDGLVVALGTDVAKSSTMLENQIRGWLESYGWMAKRESTGQRRYGFRQPEVWPPVIEEEEEAPAAGPVPETHDEGPQAHADYYGGSDDEPF